MQSPIKISIFVSIRKNKTGFATFYSDTLVQIQNLQADTNDHKVYQHIFTNDSRFAKMNRLFWWNGCDNLHATAKRKLERLQFSTSSSFVKIWSASSCEFKAYFWTFSALYHLLFYVVTIGVNYIIIWWLVLEKKPK